MAEAILDALGPVLTRWTMGGNAVAFAPAEWHEALGSDTSEAELRLLALSGQFLGALVLAEPAGEVRVPADIPALSCPPLADALRPRARRVLATLREPARRRLLLDFLDRRGWTLHPGDWMPGPNDDVPGSYAAWQDWAAAYDTAPSATGQLAAENWDTLGPAARRAAFAALRRTDPSSASALLGEKIAGETAGDRVRLIEAFGAGLSDADRPLLEALAADRAPRVKALAASLLARLGGGSAEGDQDAAELAGFFPLQTKGLLRRSRVIAPQQLKTPAQRNRRTALMETVSLDGFARALGVPLNELVAAWPWGTDHTADQLLAGMTARSATDAIVAQMAEAVTASAFYPHALLPLLERLAPPRRRAAAAQLLRVGSGGFAMALAIAGGDGRIDDVIRTAAGKALVVAVAAENARPGEQSDELLALGLIASRPAARQALEQLAAVGLIASDPRLDMLRLNAALEDKGATE